MTTDNDSKTVQQLAGRIGASVQLQGIVLRELNWSLPEQLIPGGLSIDLRPEFEAQAATSPGLLIYKIRTEISAVVPDEVEIFHFRAVHQLVFSFPEGLEFTREEVEAFGSTSAMFMVFPYVREALQGTAAKAGMPNILLQPLRLPVPLNGEPDRDLAKAGAESAVGD